MPSFEAAKAQNLHMQVGGYLSGRDSKIVFLTDTEAPELWCALPVCKKTKPMSQMAQASEVSGRQNGLSSFFLCSEGENPLMWRLMVKFIHIVDLHLVAFLSLNFVVNICLILCILSSVISHFVSGARKEILYFFCEELAKGNKSIC